MWRYKVNFIPYPKKVAHWYGTDALKLVMCPPGAFRWHVKIFLQRIFWRLMWRFFDEHWINTPKLAVHLIKFGISENRIKHVEVPWKKVKYKKVKHDGFNILFYMPKSTGHIQKYKNWIYGKKYLDYLRKWIKDVNWIVLDGSYDMSEVYPIADAYIKVNKHAGSDYNRIAKECFYNNIDVFLIDDFIKSEFQNKCEVVKWIHTKRDMKNIRRKRKDS